MAKQIIFKVDLDASQADQAIDEFLKGTDSAKQKLKELTKAAQEAALAGNDALANKFTKAAGQLKDQIGDVNSAIRNFASDTRKLDVAVGAVRGLAGAFATAQGAAALFGTENQDLQKTLNKVQGSLAVLNGLQEVANTLNKESAVGAKLYAASNKILNSSFLQVSGGLKAFRVALIGTGIGAVALAVGALIANFDDLKAAVLRMVPGLETIGTAFTNLKNAVMDFFGFDSEAKRGLSKSLEDVGKSIENTEAWLNMNKDKYDEFTQKKFDIDLEYKKKKKELIEKAQKEERDVTKKEQADLDAWRVRQIGNVDKARADAAKKSSDEAAKVAKDNADKQKREDEKREEERIARLDADQKRRLALIEDAGQRELAIFDYERAKIKEAAKKNGEDLVLVEQETQMLRTAIINDQIEKRKEKEKEETEKTKASLVEQLDNYSKHIADKRRLYEADGEMTLDELDRIQVMERDLLEKQLENKIISQEQYDATKIEMNNELFKKQEEIIEKSFNKQYSIMDAWNGRELEDAKTKFDRKNKLLEDSLKRGEITDAQYKEKQLENEKEFEDKKAEIRKSREADIQAAAQVTLEALTVVSDFNNMKLDEEKNKNQEQYDSQKALLDKQLSENLISREQYNNSLQNLDKKLNDANTKAAKVAFEKNKKVQIATAIIEGIGSVVKALNNPFPLNIVLAGIAAATSAVNIAKIKNTKFEGGSSGGGGGDVGGGAAGASVGQLASSFTGQKASSVITPQGMVAPKQEPQKVYVVESDISTTQNRVKLLEDNANAKF